MSTKTNKVCYLFLFCLFGVHIRGRVTAIFAKEFVILEQCNPRIICTTSSR